MPIESDVPMGGEASHVIYSMTGYGRAEGRYHGFPMLIEVKSVNHRHREVVARLPRVFQAHEDLVRNLVQAHVRRGRVDVSISVNGEREGGGELRLDRPLAKKYFSLLKELQRELGVPGTPDIGLVAGFRDVIKSVESPREDQAALKSVEHVLAQALKALTRMRRQEGRALGRDLSARLREIQRRLEAVGKRVPHIVKEHYTRTEARLNRLLESVGDQDRVDPVRLAQEVALLADRSDISEELTRLDSHLQQFRGFLRKTEPVGRNLDFLLQEMNREVTTLTSKVGDITVTQEILAVKAELEKVREQVQNVE